MNNLVYWVWLTNLSGIFSNKINALLEYFDSVEEIYKAGIDDYKNVQGITRGDSLVLNSKDLSHAEEIIKKTSEIGAQILTYDDIDYPDALRRIDSPPYVLYIKGEVMQWDRLLMIAVVGTRRCTDYGVKAATHICYELAKRGITVVSGMARGIDTAAAVAALRAGNKTIAVLGCGLDIVYPPENKKLMAEIERHGAVISEYPPGSKPLGMHFPERNRIISGLSKGVLVAEAPIKSGALITAGHALEAGKDLFAVPGSIFSYNSKGTNLLIKQGAKVTESALDIIEEYPIDAQRLEPPEAADGGEFDNYNELGAVEDIAVNNIKNISLNDEKYKNLSENEKAVILLLIEKNMNIDEIKLRTGFEMSEINAMLPMMEIYGLVRKLPGDNYKLEV